MMISTNVNNQSTIGSYGHINQTNTTSPKQSTAVSHTNTHAADENSQQYFIEDEVHMSISHEGILASQETTAKYDKGFPALSEEQASVRAEQERLMEESIVHLPGRRFINNIQTNQKLTDSLEGLDDNVINAAYSIIEDHLLPTNIGTMSEQERKDQIALGMEKATYLAENYLEGDQKTGFLEAMETIAKYGMNGSAAEDGEMTYHIERGPMVGQPNDSVNMMSVLEEFAPEMKQEFNEIFENLRNGKGGPENAKRFKKLMEKANQFIHSDMGNDTSYAKHTVDRYEEWNAKIEETEVSNPFKNTNNSSLQGFIDSLKGQSILSNEWIDQSINDFMKLLLP